LEANALTLYPLFKFSNFLGPSWHLEEVQVVLYVRVIYLPGDFDFVENLRGGKSLLKKAVFYSKLQLG